jgi:ribosomal protein S18 acetylase RimI-like enzyme
MVDIVEPLRPSRTLAKPKKFTPLRSFSAGRQGTHWEKTVNEWARSVYLGTQADAQTVVVLEDAQGKLIGVSSFRPESPDGPQALTNLKSRLLGTPQYIHMLGIDRRYQGHRLRDGSRLGDVLLSGTLEQIAKACNDRLPEVWALVTPENARARALFARHGFRELPYAGVGEIAYVRCADRRAGLQSAIRLGGRIAARREQPKKSAAAD